FLLLCPFIGVFFTTSMAKSTFACKTYKHRLWLSFLTPHAFISSIAHILCPAPYRFIDSFLNRLSQPFGKLMFMKLPKPMKMIFEDLLYASSLLPCFVILHHNPPFPIIGLIHKFTQCIIS